MDDMVVPRGGAYQAFQGLTVVARKVCNCLWITLILRPPRHAVDAWWAAQESEARIRSRSVR
jgi:hypothetical protein